MEAAYLKVRGGDMKFSLNQQPGFSVRSEISFSSPSVFNLDIEAPDAVQHDLLQKLAKGHSRHHGVPVHRVTDRGEQLLLFLGGTALHGEDLATVSDLDNVYRHQEQFRGSLVAVHGHVLGEVGMDKPIAYVLDRRYHVD